MTPITWNAAAFFKQLTETNKLAVEAGFRYRDISSLKGLEEVVSSMLNTKAWICCCDNDAGSVVMEDNTPHTNLSKMVVLAMRYKVDSMEARAACIDKMATIFRQFCSALLRDEMDLLTEHSRFNPHIELHVIPNIITPGVAAMYFVIGTTTFHDLCYDPDEWLQPNASNGHNN